MNKCGNALSLFPTYIVLHSHVSPGEENRGLEKQLVGPLFLRSPKRQPFVFHGCVSRIRAHACTCGGCPLISEKEPCSLFASLSLFLSAFPLSLSISVDGIREREKPFGGEVLSERNAARFVPSRME